MSYEKALTRVVAEVVAPLAAETDRAAAYPRRQLDALAAEGCSPSPCRPSWAVAGWA
ncbi:hypothetical protein [Motilibacter peucedani]|uniref:hypothetical protein n=1 Tax=Motilibacter peucedani TaxID=598650 RepID=UPI001E40E073|nr:hypothetical protein [Motilibacter peucedani]